MITIRRATATDSRMVFDWANDPETRANSISTEPIPWENHERWFAGKLAAAADDLFVVLADGEPAGMVRFEWDGGDARIGVNVAPAFRGKGLSSEMIRAAVSEVRLLRMPVAIVANIKHANTASIRAFSKADFVADGEEVVRGVSLLRYVWRPE